MSGKDHIEDATLTEASAALSSLLKVQNDVMLQEPIGRSIEYYLFEKYAGDQKGWKRRVYYLAKPLIPRTLQIALRRKYATAQSTNEFPAWPIEPGVVALVQASLRRALQDHGRSEIFRIAPWPKGKSFAFTITHDIEWAEGMARAYALVEVEKTFGFTSSWNVVPERYPIDRKVFDKLRSDGLEIGVHGLKHDGKLFSSRRSFERRLKRIRHYATLWGAAGFRSPSTLRKVDWIPELGFHYDTSFPDTDPYEPQPGGCCSIWPFFIKDCVELPITMPQDHTLFEILGQRDISIWKQKADWIEANGGLVLINVHPDYMKSKENLRLYENVLSYMKVKDKMWHVQPKEVARWWRERDASRLTKKDGIYVIEGPAADRAAIIRTRLVSGVLEDEYLG